MTTMITEYTARNNGGIEVFGTLRIEINKISNAKYTAAKLRAEKYLKLTGFHAINIDAVYEAPKSKKNYNSGFHSTNL
jgi:hypothetical protein